MKWEATATQRTVLTFAGTVALPLVWIFIKYVVGVSDRFLPSPVAVLRAVEDIHPTVWHHLALTALRLVVGFVLGIAAGIFLALGMIRSAALQWFLMPMLQSLRPVPAAAVVPFFLLWFGFSEGGRYLLVVTAIAFNIAIAAWQILQHTPDNHVAFFHSFHLRPGHLLWRYSFPRIAEGILPTLRFSMALAIGAVTVSELLGSQVALPFLSTFSSSRLYCSDF